MPHRTSRRHFCKTHLVAGSVLCGGAPYVRGAATVARHRPPNLLFVMADEWRRQAMGYAGEDPVRTPHFDRFAADALVFNQSCATRPICSPSRSSLLTGLYPQRHGLYMNGLAAPLNPALPILGTWLKQAGYRTSYVGKLHTGGEPEQRGIMAASHRSVWDHWVHAIGHRPYQQPYYIDAATRPAQHDGWAPDFETDQTIEFIRAQRNAPFAAVLSWGPPHTGGGPGFEDRWQPGKRTNGKIDYGHGYAAPAAFEAPYHPFEKLPRRPNVRPVPIDGGRGAGDPSDFTLPGYYGACSSLDAAFGRLMETLRELNLYDNTLVVFTSDHGDMLGSQGRMQKGIHFEESIGVPLLMRLGGQLPARRVDNLISTIDLAPTMLGLLGLNAGSKLDGSDFAAFARGRAESTTEALHLSFDAGGPKAKPDQGGGARRAWRTLRTGRYSYTLLEATQARSVPHQNRRVLYDLREDPFQVQPIFGGKHQPVIDELHGRLLAHLTDVGDDFATTKFVWS